MKILAIRGCNLASLEGEFGIDFTVEPLLSAGIFGISGPTGAGKSTLLDAMCLALFARTPRMVKAGERGVQIEDVGGNTVAQNDSRSILRRGTASGYAEVDFLALNGHRYRSRWSVRRSRDKADGALQKITFMLRNLDTGMEEQGTSSDLMARVVKLIGLTFEQFTRSVLLAQNDFSTFLRAEQSEKASLLEKMTGTELFANISRCIYEKNSIAKEAYERVYESIKGIEVLTDEEEQQLKNFLEEAEKLVSSLEKAREEEQTLRRVVRTAEQQLEARQREQKDAAIRLQKAMELLNTARREYEKGKEEEQRSEASFKALQQELQLARKKDVELGEALRSQKEAKESLDASLLRKREGEDRLRAARLRLKQCSADIMRITQWRARYADKESIARQLSALTLHLDTASAARQTMKRAEGAISSARQEMENLARQLKKAQLAAETKSSEIERAEEAIRAMEQKLKATDREALEAKTKTLREQRENLLVEQARLAAAGTVMDMREMLQEGVPCPVCGSLHHPAATGTTRTELQKQIDALTLQIEQLTLCQTSYTNEEKQLGNLRRQLVQLNKELSVTQQSRSDFLAKQKIEETSISREEAVLKESSETLLKSLSAANILFGGDEWQNNWQKDPESFRGTLTSFAQKWNENTEQLQQLQQKESAGKAECASVESFLPSLIKQAEEASSKHKQSLAELTRLKKERSELLSGKPADKVEKEYNDRKEALKERLKKLQAVQTEQSDIAARERGISQQIASDVEKLSEDLKQCREALSLWMESWKKEHSEETLEELLTRATGEKNNHTFRLRTNEENKKKIAEKQKELEECRLRSERWAKLNDLAGSADGAKFRRIAQGYTLDALLYDTNVQLRNLSRRYHLKRVTDTLALQVIDHDMCDEVRSVHSLSGGESFLVSLALALGLSSLSSGRMRVESLFIDEGFGSLDAETLRVAMDALENLRTQGRKIGVISHVQEMTERIPVQIRVCRAGNGRSYLEKIESI